MYILIKEDTNEALIFEAKSDLSSYLGMHRNTISNKFSKTMCWEHEKGTVYSSNKVYKRSRSGNTDTKNVREAKLRGEIEYKTK